MGDDDKEEGKEEIDSDAEPERLQYKVKSTKLQTLHSPIDHIFVAFKKIINGIMAIIS